MSASLIKRILSSLVLAPLVLFVIWYGSWPFIILMVVAFLVAMYEWVGMVKNFKYAPLCILFGILYVGFSFYSFYMLQNLKLALYVLLLVWASDIGAYLFGKLIGGAKLLPKVSPNKTWAGLAGAILCPFVVVLVITSVDRVVPFELMPPIILAVIVGVLGQSGDLFISFIKRKAELKDTGSLIPGHGGLLDRVDALMLISSVLFLIFYSYKYLLDLAYSGYYG